MKMELQMVVLEMEVEVASGMVDANNAPRLCAHALEEAKMPFNESVVKSECVADDANNTIRKNINEVGKSCCEFPSPQSRARLC